MSGFLLLKNLVAQCNASYVKSKIDLVVPQTYYDHFSKKSRSK